MLRCILPLLLVASIAAAADPDTSTPAERYAAAVEQLRAAEVAELEAAIAAEEASRGKDRAKNVRKLRDTLKKAKDAKTAYEPKLPAEGIKVGDVGHLPGVSCEFGRQLDERRATITSYYEVTSPKTGKRVPRGFAFVTSDVPLADLPKVGAFDVPGAFEVIAIEEKSGYPVLRPIRDESIKAAMKPKR